MNDFPASLKKMLRITLFALSISFFGWAIFPSLRAICAGFILGTLASLINSMYLAWKVNQVGLRVIQQNSRRVNMGFISRVAVAFIVVLLALEYREHFNLGATLIGLFFIQAASLVMAAVDSRGKNKQI